MTDRKIMDEWPGNEPRGGKDGLRRGNARGLHLQQIVEPGEEEVYSGVGTNLRAERQRQQFSLVEIANALRIQQAHLSALEEGRTGDLPGPAYAIGFLRSYSEFLNLDGEEIIRQFKREATLVPVERRLVFPEPLDEARRPGLRLALVSLLVAGAVYGGWIFLEQRWLLPIEVVAEPPERLAPYQVATVTPETPLKAGMADTAMAPPTPAPWAVGGNAVENDAPAASLSPGPLANTADAGAGEPQANEPDTKIADADAAAPEAVLGVTAGTATETAAEVTAGITPIQPMQPATPPIDAGATGQTAMTVTERPHEGGAAAGTDIYSRTNTAAAPAGTTKANTGVSIGDMPASANLATTANTPVAPITPDTAEITGPPAVEDRTAPAVATEDAVPAPPVVPRPLAPLREGGDVDTAPAVAPVQAAIDPPPPPAAPSAPARSIREGASGEASAGDAGRTFTSTAAGPGYRPQAYGASNRDARVVLRARAESWVQVQGANNELLLTRMLRAGDSYHAPNRNDLVLMTGNAGAIEIIVDGEALGALGPIGQVRRDIRLSADYLRAELRSTSDSGP